MSDSILIEQNRVIISLLARQTITSPKIEEIVTRWKKKGLREKYIQAYNALDGSKSIVQVAKIAEVSPQNMGGILEKWEEEGIVYKEGSGKNAKYIGLLKLPLRSQKKSTKRTRKTRTRTTEPDLPKVNELPQDANQIDKDATSGS